MDTQIGINLEIRIWLRQPKLKGSGAFLGGVGKVGNGKLGNGKVGNR